MCRWSWVGLRNAPVDLAVLQECLPSLESSWNWLAYVIEDEDSFSWDIVLGGRENLVGIEHCLQQIRLANYKLGVYGLEVVGDLVWRVRGICSRKCPTSGYDTQCNDWVVDLKNGCLASFCCCEDSEPTSLKEHMTAQSPFWKPCLRKPAATLQMSERPSRPEIHRDGFEASM
jgi:hypothetical protein